MIVDRIGPFVGGSTVRGAVQLFGAGREVSAVTLMRRRDEDLDTYPASQRFDQRTVARLDDHER